MNSFSKTEQIGAPGVKETDWFREVKRLYFWAYQSIENKGDEVCHLPTNHWMTYLKLVESTSVQVDMVPDDGDASFGV